MLQTEKETPEETKEGTQQPAPSLTEQINAYFPYPYISSISVIFVFFLLGKLIDLSITAIARRLVTKTKSDFDDNVVKLLHRPVFLSTLLVGLGFATYLLVLPDKVTTVTIGILKTIAVLIWFSFGLKLIGLILAELESFENRFQFVTATTKPLLTNTFSIILTAFSVYVIFLIWNINITAWIASAGIIGLAVSFAAKDTLANIFGGVAIFADKPFKVGDFVNLDSGERGQITQIGVRSTRILTRDDIEITVPNGVLANTMVVNESGGPSERYRFRLKVGIAYDSDLDLAEKVMLDAANNHEEVCSKPEPRVRFREIGGSTLKYELLGWVERPVLRGRILHELNRKVFIELRNANVEMPFPQQDIYIKEVPESS